MLASYKLSGKYIFISGFLFTSVLGTLSHFFYEWSGDSTSVSYTHLTLPTNSRV